MFEQPEKEEGRERRVYYRVMSWEQDVESGYDGNCEVCNVQSFVAKQQHFGSKQISTNLPKQRK